MPDNYAKLPQVVSREDWESARKELLAREKELTRARDALNAERRRLPMVRIEKDYVFEGPAHACATLLLSRSTHPKYVQAVMGHASIGLPLDLYSHWAPSMGKHAASAMDAVLENEDFLLLVRY